MILPAQCHYLEFGQTLSPYPTTSTCATPPFKWSYLQTRIDICAIVQTDLFCKTLAPTLPHLRRVPWPRVRMRRAKQIVALISISREDKVGEEAVAETLVEMEQNKQS